MTTARLDAPSALVDLIDYQAGSVVSQALMKARAGTVTLFAFDEGEGLSEHMAPFDALVVVVDGRAVVSVGEAEHPMGEGDVMLLPANVPHALRAVDPFKMLLVMVREAADAS